MVLSSAGCADADGEPPVGDQVHAGLAPTVECSPSSIEKFGWYAAADYIDETASHANMSWSWANPYFTIDELAAQAVADLERGARTDTGLVLSLEPVFFGPGRTLLPAAEYQSRWSAYAAAIAPYRSSITALYPMDEPTLACDSSSAACAAYQAQMEAALGVVAAELEASFPEVPIALIHTANEIRASMLGRHPMMNPAGFDWLAVDCYGNFDSCAGASIPAYVDHIESRLRPGQRMLLVGDAWTDRGPGGKQSSELELLSLAHAYHDLASREPLIIGIVGFLWRHPDMIGAAERPAIARIWESIGHCTTAPQVFAAGSGCDDRFCIWMTGSGFSDDSYVDIRRADGSPEIIAQYAGAQLVRDLASSPQALSLRLDDPALRDLFATEGLRLWVVNPRRGNWSRETLVRQ